MGRPSKSASVFKGVLNKEVAKKRLETEQKLKGDCGNIIPPDYLNENQTYLFSYIVEQLKASNMLGNLDVYVLSTCVIAIDRLQEIEKIINNDFEQIMNKNLMTSKDKYTRDFFKCCGELSLSPQARAKIGVLNVQKKEEEGDDLLKLLRGGKG